MDSQTFTSRIPEQLQKPEFRFVLLGQWDIVIQKTKRQKPVYHGKMPFEKNWQTTSNYAFDNPKLLKHPYNFGVVGGFGRLRILDIDSKELGEELEKRLNTYTIKTGGGGKHFYFTSDYNTNHVLANGLGELRADKYQVVSAPCRHPSGNYYEIVKDVPILEISAEDLKALIEPYLRKDNTTPTTPTSTLQTQNRDTSRSGEEMRAVVKMLYAGKTEEQIRQEMQVYAKWSESPEQYRELTLKKAREYVNSHPANKITEETPIFFFNDNTDGSGDNIKAIEEYIWFVNEKNGESKLITQRVAELLIKRFRFLTVGSERFEVYYYKDGIYQKGGEKIIGSTVQRWTQGACKNYHVNEVIGHIKRLTYAERTIFDTEPYLICLKNGVYNAKTNTFEKHTPDLFFTQKVNCNYEPQADCPAFKKFLSEVLQSGDIPTMQEFFGFSLVREYFIKKAMILVGERDTGKTTLLKAFTKFIGEKNISGVSLHRMSGDKFCVASMEHKLANVYDDLTYEDIRDLSTFKMATGCGYISAEKKFGEMFQFLNYAKLMFATNKISDVDESDDDAYYIRWIIIFFNNSFEKPDTHLIDKITTESELSGIFNWAIEGLKRLMTNNRFTYNKDADENKLLMERSSNTVSAFAQDILIENTTSWISKDDLYNIYCAYILHFGGARVTKDRFCKKLPLKAPYIIDGKADCGHQKAVHGWINVGFKTPEHLWTTFPTFFSYITEKLKYNISITKENCISKIIDYSIKKIGNPVPEERIDTGEKQEQSDLSQKILLKHQKIRQNIIDFLTRKETATYFEIEDACAEDDQDAFFNVWIKMKQEGVIFEPIKDVYKLNP